MVSRFIVLVASLALASAGNPQYEFGYDVQDSLTGDSKNQFETRSGDFVQGQYSLNDPDGTRRIVDYVADPINGFNAQVRKEPLVAAPAISKVAAAPVLPALRTAAVLPQPAIAATPFLRSTIAAPAFANSPILSSYAAPGIVGSPLLRSYGYNLGSSPILSSRLVAPSLGYSSAYAPSLGYAATYGSAIGYSGALGYPSISKIAAQALGYSTLLH